MGNEDLLTQIVMSDNVWYYYFLLILSIVAILVPCAIYQIKWADRADKQKKMDSLYAHEKWADTEQTVSEFELNWETDVDAFWRREGVNY